MPETYTVQYPNGQLITKTFPDGASDQDIRAAFGLPQSEVRRTGMFAGNRNALSAPQDTFADRGRMGIANALSALGVDERYAHHVGDRAFNFLNDVTPVGDAVSADDARTAWNRGDYLAAGGNALLAALGAVPAVGDGAKRAILEAVSEFKVKPPKRLYRGLTVNADDSIGMGDHFLGKGLYSSPSKEHAQRYAMNRGADLRLTPNHAIQELSPEEAFPRNPLVLSGSNDAGAVFNDWMMKQTGLRASEISRRWPDPSEYVRSLGYDGVVIGDEVVRYPPK